MKPTTSVDWTTKESREYLAHLQKVAMPGERVWDGDQKRIECGDETVAYDVSGFDGGNREGKLLVAATNALPQLLGYIEELEKELQDERERKATETRARFFPSKESCLCRLVDCGQVAACPLHGGY